MNEVRSWKAMNYDRQIPESVFSFAKKYIHANNLVFLWSLGSDWQYTVFFA